MGDGRRSCSPFQSNGLVAPPVLGFVYIAIGTFANLIDALVAGQAANSSRHRAIHFGANVCELNAEIPAGGIWNRTETEMKR